MNIVYIFLMITKGSIVSYKKYPAVVLETGEKFTIEYPVFPTKPTGKISYTTQSVRSKDIILLHQGPLSSVSHLQCSNGSFDTDQSITASLIECWELLISDDSTLEETLSIKELSELTLGSYDANLSFCIYSTLLNLPHFIAVQNDKSEYPSFTINTVEKVSELLAKENEKEEETQRKKEFIQRLKTKKIDSDKDAQFMQEIEALALGKTDKSKFLKEAKITETPESAHKILLETGFWSITKNPHPSRWGLSMQSADETLSSPPEEQRLTLEHTAFAIDNAWSTDPDDAISFDGTFIWIHVADPSSTVHPGSSIDISARNRGSTLYIPEGASRMLSEESIEDYALGLGKEGSKSRALSFKILLDDSGSIQEVDVLKTLVPVKRLTYTEADTLKDTEELRFLYTIAQSNIQRRKDSGAVFIELPEVNIQVKKENAGEDSVTINTVKKTESSSVVREFMLLAGEGAARFAFKNNIPFPFVSQAAPDIPKEIPEGLAGQYRLRRCMRSRSVGVTPSAHAGLGLSMYSQVTSPLRRYGDLVAHQQLRSFIDKSPLLSKDEVLERISAGDAASSASSKAERKSNLHWTLVYLLQNPQWTGKAVAVEEKGKQWVFLIPSLSLETLINPNNSVSLNDSITVKPGKINLSELSITFIQT